MNFGYPERAEALLIPSQTAPPWSPPSNCGPPIPLVPHESPSQLMDWDLIFHPPHVPITTPGSGLPCNSRNWPIQCLPKETKKPWINLVFSHLVDAYGEHVKGHKSINSTLSFYLGGMTNCIQRPSFAQNRMSEKFACDNQNLGGLTTKTKHPQIKKTVN